LIIKLLRDLLISITNALLRENLATVLAQQDLKVFQESTEPTELKDREDPPALLESTVRTEWTDAMVSTERKDRKEFKDPREIKDSMERKDRKEFQDPREIQDPKELKEYQDHPDLASISLRARLATPPRDAHTTMFQLAREPTSLRRSLLKSHARLELTY